MNILNVDSSKISRICEIDRTEVIEAKFRWALAPDGNSIALIEEKFDPPEIFPDWDDAGVKRRVNRWKVEVDEGGALFFAENNGELAGFAILGPEKAGKSAEIVALFIDKSHRAKGIGGRLVRRLEIEAREKGIEKIYVQSNPTTTSVGFYRSVGYRITCLLDASLMWIPGLETDIVLAKRLLVQSANKPLKTTPDGESQF